MIVFAELLVVCLLFVIVLALLWLSLRRSPFFTVTVETLADDDTAEALSEFNKAKKDVDRELALTNKRIKRGQSVSEILADARKKEWK